jgi:hypothetical protein
MIREADYGCFLWAPQSIKTDCPEIPCVDSYDELLTMAKEKLALFS